MRLSATTAITGAGLAHLDYLRALRRKGREMLARIAPQELSPCRWDDAGSLDVR